MFFLDPLAGCFRELAEQNGQKLKNRVGKLFSRKKNVICKEKICR